MRIYGDSNKNIFYIEEGKGKHYFVQSGKVHCHLMLSERMHVYRIFASFPEFNQGLALHVSKYDVGEKFEMRFVDVPCVEEEEKREVLKCSIEFLNSKVVFSDILWENIRTIREVKYRDPYRERKEIWDFFFRHHKEGEKIERSLQTCIEIGKAMNKKSVRIFRHDELTKNYYEALLLFNEEVEITLDNKNQKLSLFHSGEKPISCELKIWHTLPPLNAYSRQTLLSIKEKEFLKTLPEREKAIWERGVCSLQFLSYKEKFLAGSYRFLTYFGRDTLISLSLLWDVLSKEAIENGIVSVLKRLSSHGSVAHEEDIGDQGLFRYAEVWRKLFLLGEEDLAYMLWESRRTAVYDYKMVDDDFLLPLLWHRYMKEEKFSFEEKKSFLSQHIFFFLLNAEYCLKKATPYVDNSIPSHLISLDDIYVGDWRDSIGGLAGGKYSLSVNGFLVPMALQALEAILPLLEMMGWNVLELCAEMKLLHAQEWFKNDSRRRNFIEKWQKAKYHFRVELSSEEVRKRLRNYVERNGSFSLEEKEYFLDVTYQGVSLRSFLYENKELPFRENRLVFYALSLDENGERIEVMNSDAVFALFYGNSFGEKEFQELLQIFELPYPLGLMSPIGVFVANPAYTENDKLYSQMDKRFYHGTVVWGWQEHMLRLALLSKQKEGLTTVLGDQILCASLQNREQASDFEFEELYSYQIKDKRLFPVAYGASSKTETESNPVQLWSCAILSLLYNLYSE